MVLSIVIRVLIVVALVGLVIFVHELGHFLAARRLGLVVDVFSLGFGPAIWKRKVGGIVYKIGVFPLGGYVAIPQLDPAGMEKVQGAETPADKASGEAQPKRDLPDVPPWKRIVVACAGPLGNVLLSLALAWCIYLAPHAVTGGAGTLIGTVETNSPAWHAGLRPGQTIERVNGGRVATWFDFMIECHLAGDAAHGVVLTVNDAGQARDVHVPLATVTNSGMSFSAIEGVIPRSTCHVSDVESNSVAQAAGIHSGDALRSVNGLAIVGTQQFVDYMAANGTRPVTIEIEHAGQRQMLTLMPRYSEAAGKAVIGVRLGDAFQDVPAWMQYSKPWRQIKGDASQVFRLLRALLFPQHKGEASRAANSVGGMPTIVAVLWGAIKTGLLNTLGLLRMIGINLAVINLLPIPVLDGGHVLFAAIEGVTRRKPNPKLVAAVVNFFAALIIGLMLLLIVRDPVVRPVTNRLFERFAKKPPHTALTPASAVPPVNAAPTATVPVPAAVRTNLPARETRP